MSPSIRQGAAAFSLVLLSAAVPAPIAAQCALQWQPAAPVQGVQGEVHALVHWDPDGAGPATPLVVIGGNVAVAGSVVSRGIATHDPATGVWGTLGGGFSPFTDRVMALAVLPNGWLVAGGQMVVAGTSGVGVAAWNGTAWSVLGTIGLTNHVLSLAVLPNGDLVAGGTFQHMNGVPAARVARWNGVAWSALGGGIPGVPATVNAVAALPNGDVIAGGYFLNPAPYIARWNGTTWSPLGTGVQGIVQSLAVLPNGHVIAGGRFQQAGAQLCQRIARWNGLDWQPLGPGVDGLPPYLYEVTVASILVRANGNLAIGGSFTSAGGVVARCVAEWNGISWSSFGTGIDGRVQALAETAAGELWFGGAFAQALPSLPAPPVAGANLMRWNGTNWQAAGVGSVGAVYTITSRPTGETIVGGSFSHFGGVAAANIAQQSALGWQALGSGVNGAVLASLRLPNGDVVIGGAFTQAGGFVCNGIARWNGAAWSPVGIGCNGTVRALARLSSGDLLAAGEFTNIGGTLANNIARWNGSSWAPLGAGVDGGVAALLVRANGELFVGGLFASAGGVPASMVARWNGTSWSSLGAGFTTPVNALAELRNGDVVAGGYSLIPGSDAVARWTGTTWSGFSGGGVALSGSALLALPDGGFVLGTSGSGGVHRWTGSSFVNLGVTAGGLLAGSSYVKALHQADDGRLVVVGDFGAVGGIASAAIARLQSPCAPSAVFATAGCTGSAGPVLLSTTHLPWLGAAFVATTAGVPAGSFAVAVWGLGAVAIPLPLLLAQGAPGCLLAVTPDVLQILVPNGPLVTSLLPVPNTASLLGQSLFHQVAPVELGAGGAIVEVTGSNSLQLTLGSF